MDTVKIGIDKSNAAKFVSVIWICLGNYRPVCEIDFFFQIAINSLKFSAVFITKNKSSIFFIQFDWIYSGFQWEKNAILLISQTEMQETLVISRKNVWKMKIITIGREQDKQFLVNFSPCVNIVNGL